MKKLFIILSALTLALTLQAQPATIQGQVFLQNSKTRTGTLQTIPGVEIKADSAAPTTSDAQGRFTLRFTAVKDLKQARITAHKHSLVLVNEHELLSATIGGEATLKVFLADSALLAQEQAILYDINLKVLTREKDRLIAKFKGDSATCAATIAELEERFNREFEHRWAAQDFLEEQLQRMKEQLPERMAELARVNLDFANEHYVRAYGLFKEGQTELAMRLLDSLDVEAEKATERLEEVWGRKDAALAARDSVDNWARQIVASYRLKAEGHNLKFEYRKAAVILEKGLVVLLRIKRGVEDLEVAMMNSLIGTFHKEYGDYPKAMVYFQENLRIFQHSPNIDLLELGPAYNNIGVVFLEEREYDRALYFLQKAIGVLETAEWSDHWNIIATHNNLAIAQKGLGNFVAAYQELKYAISIWEAHEKTIDLRIATIYDHLSTILQELDMVQEALDASLLACSLSKVEDSCNSPKLCPFLNNLAVIYKKMEQNALSLEILEKTISIMETSPNPNYPNLAIMYDNLAMTLLDLQRPEDALQKVMIAIGQFEKHDPSNLTNLTTAHMNLAIVYKVLGKATESMGAFRKCLLFLGEDNSINPLLNVAVCSHLGESFLKAHELDSSMKYLLKAIMIFNEMQKPSGELGDGIARHLTHLHHLLGNVNQLRRDYSKAIDEYHLALIFSPNNSEVLNSMGLAFYNQKEYRKAIECYEATDWLPTKDKPVYLNNMGMAFSKLRRFRAAARSFDELETMLPLSPYPFRAWSVYFALRKDDKKSLQNLEKAIQLGYTDIDWIQTEEAFDKLRDHPRYIALIKSLEEKPK